MKQTISEIIGRDASEVTKRKKVEFPVKLVRTKTPHIAMMYHIEVLTKYFR